MDRPAWFIGSLLGMLAFLMAAHLSLLGVSVYECAKYADVLIGQVKKGAITEIVDGKNTCTDLEFIFEQAANQYISVILALLGGAATAGTAIHFAKKGRSNETPKAPDEE